MSTSRLFRDRRFWPIFFTQLLGAFNDNFFKNALVILITFKSAQLWGLSSEQLVVLAGGIFILPFFLFSATAGQLADRYEKAYLIVGVKIFEIGIMGAAAYGFLTNHVSFLMLALFLMGFHSTLFGPVKYSYLPQLLKEESELVAANALFQMGTFLAILVGTIAGGLAISAANGPMITSVLALAFAAAGLGFSFYVLPTRQRQESLNIEWNPVTPTVRVFRETLKRREVYLSILGISWFWFYGAAMLSLFPPFGKNVLHGNEHVVTCFLALFSVGIGIGSMQCKRLSGDKLELGLVPFGSLGLTVFAVDLYFASPTAPPASGELASLTSFLFAQSGWRIALDLFLMAFFGGLYIVPLMTLIQQRSDKAFLSRIIASNNILNALAMVLASVLLMVLLGAGVSIPQIFLVVGVLNLAVAVYIYRLMPEFTLRFAAWLLANTIYWIRPRGLANIPETGACVLICNHVTFVDWLFIQASCRRPIRFVMDHTFLRLPFVGFIFRDAKVIPIAQSKENPHLKEAAFFKVKAELEAGNIVCIFPEGRLTRDGELSTFRGGIERIIQETPVPVVPMAMQGLWDSVFSKNPEVRRMTFMFKWGKRVELAVSEPIAAKDVTAAVLEARVRSLLGSMLE